MPFTGYTYAPALAAIGQAFGNIGDGFAEQNKRQALAALGTKLQAGDYDGAAQTAFAAGDIQTGTSLLKLGQGAKAGPELARALGGLYGSDAGASGPVPLSPLGQRSDATPSAPANPAFAGGKTAMQMPADPDIENRFISTLKDGGLTNPNGLAAVAAYANAESRYSPQNITGSWADPSQSGQPGTSGGILSWRGPRLQAMRQMTAGADDPVAAQAKFMLTENPDLTVALQNAKTPEEAHSLMADAWRFAGWDKQGGENARRLALTQSYLGRVGGTAAPQTASAPAPVSAPVQTADASPDVSQPLQLDPGSAYRLKQGVAVNPNVPVTAYVAPNVIQANPGAFLGSDGKPLPAGQVYAALSGGSPSAAGAGAPSPIGVRTASNDPKFVPANVAGMNPSQVLVSQAQGRSPAPAAANSDPLVVVPGINGGRPINKAWVAAAPDGADVPDDGILEAAQARALGGSTSAPAPAPAPEHVSAAAPQILSRAGMPSSVPQAMAATPDPNKRVRILLQASMIPGLSEGQQGVVKTLLQNELEQTKLPDDVKKYVYARSQDPNVGTFTQWSDRNQKGSDDTSDIKNYAAAKKDGYSGTFADFLTSVKRAGAMSVNIDQKVAGKDAEAIAAAKVEDPVEAIKGRKPAAQRLQTLSELADAWSTAGDNVTTGPTGEATLKLKQLASGVLGYEPKGLTQTELIQKVGTQLAAQASKELTSRPTQFDFKVFLDNNPSITLSPGGNKALINLMQQKARNDLALSDIARSYDPKKLSDDWGKIVTDFDRTHPIISPLTHKPLDPNEVIYPGQPGQGGAGGAGGQGGSNRGGQPQPQRRTSLAPGEVLTPADVAGTIANARAKIARDPWARDAVIERLRGAGIDPNGL